jgi:flotillin
MVTILIALVIAVVVLVVVMAGLIKAVWRVAEPNEALVISGAGAVGGEMSGKGDAETPSYKIAVGKGAFVIPGLQAVRKLSLNARKADLAVETVTRQGVPVQVRGIVVYKVGNTPREIANAASRFLGESEETMASTVNELFSGHLRSILGGLTMEEIIRDRARMAAETRGSSAEEMETLGLKIDSLQIQEVDDPTGYIQNLAAPHQAAVERDARIAAAEANQAATEKEQAAAAAGARAIADSEIAQSQVKAQADTARAEAEQAGPLAQAQAQKQVVVEQTEVAKLEAQRREMELQTETVKPAEAARDARIASAQAKARETELEAAANANRVEIEAGANAKKVEIEATAEAGATEKIGRAKAGAIEAMGHAEAASTAAKLGAEAEGIEKRAAALEKNNEAVIAQTLAEKAPELVRAAAESFRGIDNMIVLNGAEGVTGMAGEVMKLGLGVMPLVQQMLANGKDDANGAARERSNAQEKRPTKRD